MDTSISSPSTQYPLRNISFIPNSVSTCIACTGHRLVRILLIPTLVQSAVGMVLVPRRRVDRCNITVEASDQPVSQLVKYRNPAHLTTQMSTSSATRQASMKAKGLCVLIFDQINCIWDILEDYCIFQHYSEVCLITVFLLAFNLSMSSYPIIRNTAISTVRLHTKTTSV